TSESSACLVVSEAVSEKLGLDQAVTTAVYSSIVGSFGPALYKAEPDRYELKETLVHTGSASPSEELLTRGRILGEAVNLTRELVNRHPEEIYPETFANRAADIAADLGISGEIFDLPRLQQEKMGALLGVARGSEHDPRVVVLRYQGAGDDAPLLALCGKGVTFDSGGLSIKPSDSMITMKGDMAGAATVLGAMTAIARLKLPVNVIGVVGLVENMIGPHSYKMGEVLTSRNGTTIEVHNTDAEGRIVLADVLSYAVEQKPAALVDLATLTGACVVALGMDIVGAFTNDQDWCDSVLAASKQAGEELWQMPMHDFFGEQLKCDFADMKNIGTRWGGAITAAKFLERFVDEVPWVHLDIAGPAYAESAKPYRDVGGTGTPLRTLVELAEAFGRKK
ncbi:MAG TPA: leucyl aminopeptidase, partial [Planctomicrobium sp.]|nr:leucyl aminopeptidase [Planctomicrobium sp.]